MTLRFWFIHDTDSCHYTGLKLGRRSETGREKRVTPEFGERKRRKNSTPNSGRYTGLSERIRQHLLGSNMLNFDGLILNLLLNNITLIVDILGSVT
jgi:hypothetical protein